MSNTGNGIGMTDERVEAVVQDVKNLKSDSAALADRIETRTTETVNNTLQHIEDTVMEIWNTLSKRSTESVQAVERNVEERPFASLLAVFVAGCAIGAAGWAFGRKSPK